MKHHLIAVAMIFTIASFFLPQAQAQTVDKFYGQWQGRTYGATLYDPMVTFRIEAKGRWIDQTFGEARSIAGKYAFDNKTKLLTLFSAKGSKLYTFRLEPAKGGEKERLVDQLPVNETYKALVCYRYKK